MPGELIKKLKETKQSSERIASRIGYITLTLLFFWKNRHLFALRGKKENNTWTIKL